MGHRQRGGKHREKASEPRERLTNRENRGPNPLRVIFRRTKATIGGSQARFSANRWWVDADKAEGAIFGGFPAIHPVTNLIIFPMDSMNSYDLV